MSEEDYIEVENDWAEASGPAVLYTGVLGPCIGVGIYDTESKTGYLLHDSGAECTTLFDRFLEYVCSRCTDRKKLKVFATGAGLEKFESAEGLNEQVASSRKYVERKLHQMFDKRQLHVIWSQEDHIAELFLHTDKGRFGLQFTSNSDLEAMLEDNYTEGTENELEHYSGRF